jgi:hypothetical protein
MGMLLTVGAGIIKRVSCPAPAFCKKARPA